MGYEINFNRYFYTYTPPRALEEIEADMPQLLVRNLDEDTIGREMATTVCGQTIQRQRENHP